MPGEVEDEGYLMLPQTAVGQLHNFLDQGYRGLRGYATAARLKERYMAEKAYIFFGSIALDFKRRLILILSASLASIRAWLHRGTPGRVVCSWPANSLPSIVPAKDITRQAFDG